MNRALFTCSLFPGIMSQNQMRIFNKTYEEEYYFIKKYLLSFHSCLRIIPLTDNSVAVRKLLRWRLMLMGWGAVADWYHCHRCSLSSLRPIGKAARAPASGFRSPPRDIYLRSHVQHFPALQLHNTTTTIPINTNNSCLAKNPQQWSVWWLHVRCLLLAVFAADLCFYNWTMDNTEAFNI